MIEVGGFRLFGQRGEELEPSLEGCVGGRESGGVKECKKRTKSLRGCSGLKRWCGWVGVWGGGSKGLED